MTTPAKGRLSGIPTPGRASAIPTPRSRSSSRAGYAQDPAHNGPDVEYMSRAFADAIRANDPAQHRNTTGPRSSDVSTMSASSSASLQPLASGRRSVAGARPSSVASSSSAVSSSATPGAVRTRTPAARRPPSRTSDVFARSSSRAGRTFEPGDNVRIESLGFEGILRYLGEIDGKPGLWAGVELSGGFAGKGKNNGTVAGKQYFNCPPNCGVFVASTKLSPPTVGRPSSVASSHGRITPSLSGRVTPSNSTSFHIQSNFTPSTGFGRSSSSMSSGRITPGMTPSARGPLRSSGAANTKTPTLSGKITAGSRASKYVSMTAKQLTSRDSPGQTSPSRPSSGQKTVPNSPLLASPTRATASPYTTPKPGLGLRLPSTGAVSSGAGAGTPTKTRASMSGNTPRPRVPSAVAMPPPASPGLLSRARSLASAEFPPRDTKAAPESPDRSPPYVERELRNSASFDRFVADGASSGGSGYGSGYGSGLDSPRSPAKGVSAVVAELQARIAELEVEIAGLKAAAEREGERLAGVEALHEERDAATNQIVELGDQLEAQKEAVRKLEFSIGSLEKGKHDLAADFDDYKEATTREIDGLQAQIAEKSAAADAMKNLADEKEEAARNAEEIIELKESTIASLQTQLDDVHAELDEERRELGAQVEELRRAGQETIALYEERLSAAESERYDLEAQIARLEAARDASSTPGSAHAVAAPTATQIDNEALRDQIKHLQKKLAAAEDALEDARVGAERDEADVRERLRRFKEKDEAMRREVAEGRKEVGRLAGLEAGARQRVEEVEEDLRELTVALEDARAEVETLRELKNIHDADDVGVAPSKTLADAEAEIARLKDLLDEVRLDEQDARAQLALKTNGRAATHDLEEKIAELQHLVDSQARDLAQLRTTLDERAAELENAKKRLNREAPINGSLDSPVAKSPSSKYDSSYAMREEITGLKHIVQELQKENSAAAQRARTLEAENKLLLSEVDQLRQEVAVLEENLDQSLIREEQALDEDQPPLGSEEALQRALKEQKMRLEMELEQLRKRLADTDMKAARTTHEFNKEISELEALVESKIYREDELEQEIERLKDKLARSKKSSRGSGSSGGAASNEPRRQVSVSSMSSSLSQQPTVEELICEICEKPGHDIVTCPLLKEDALPLGVGVTVTPAAPGSTSGELFCADCESHGHVAADCPHSLEVF
ncbi:hypothetical protein HGRIS_002245 [Hohenbuehelia grisea]|uniref:CAP-Gly domain-containing protein n=1 Tax=Hohenbuehelia grisea TaxID=104357 RepID=A0ABR3JKM0_9AGAR